MDTPKYSARILSLSAPSVFILPFFHSENMDCAIPVSFDIWYVVLLVFANNSANFSYNFTPSFQYDFVDYTS